MIGMVLLFVILYRVRCFWPPPPLYLLVHQLLVIYFTIFFKAINKRIKVRNYVTQNKKLMFLYLSCLQKQVMNIHIYIYIYIIYSLYIYGWLGFPPLLLGFLAKQTRLDILIIEDLFSTVLGRELIIMNGKCS